MHISKKPLLIGLIFISFLVFIFFISFESKKNNLDHDKVFFEPNKEANLAKLIFMILKVINFF